MPAWLKLQLYRVKNSWKKASISSFNPYIFGPFFVASLSGNKFFKEQLKNQIKSVQSHTFIGQLRRMYFESNIDLNVKPLNIFPMSMNSFPIRLSLRRSKNFAEVKTHERAFNYPELTRSVQIR